MKRMGALLAIAPSLDWPRRKRRAVRGMRRDAKKTAKVGNKRGRIERRVGTPIWIFGYGSLMWDPGFPFTDVQPALLRGYHRALCIYSRVYRGTLERPGLVVGLDRGGSCRGRAFRVDGSAARSVVGYLDERELVGYAYKRVRVSIELGRRDVPAFTYVADRQHSQYAGDLGVERCVEMVANAAGLSGSCTDYVRNTVRHLHELGIEDALLNEILDRLPRDRDVGPQTGAK